MRVLYIGDIMGIGGIKAVEEVLPNLIEKHSLDFVLAQAENVFGYTNFNTLSVALYHTSPCIGLSGLVV